MKAALVRWLVLPGGAVLRGKRVRNANRNERSRGRSLLHGEDMGNTQNHSNSIEPWLAVGGGWRWMAVGSQWLVTAGRWRSAVGGGRRLAVGGPSGLSLTVVLNKNKIGVLTLLLGVCTGLNL